MKQTAVLLSELHEQERSSEGNTTLLMQEIMQLKEKIQNQEHVISDLKRQTMEDALTGVANRRAFDKALQGALAYFKRYQREGAVLLIDINDFKAVNDSLGHLAGDAILEHVASLLSAHTRQTDMVARTGGDEFCVILREVSDEEVTRKASELEAIIASTPCRYNGREVYTSVSVGACNFKDAHSKDDLMEKADRDMYTRKATLRTQSACI